MGHLRLVGALLAPALFALSPADARACTAFLLEQDGEVAVAKGYDWDQGAALVIWNKRGVAKASVPLPTRSRPLQWYSRYASLTFNQYGRELPVGGMNEAGLMVETLWLAEARDAPVDDRPAVNELQWVQWALDSFASVDELTAAVQGVRIERIHGRVHYLACDREARCAVCEPLAGGLTCLSGQALPARTLTNDTYPASRAFLETHLGFGGERPVPRGRGSLERFARATAEAALPPPPRVEPETRAFAILDSVRLGDYTKWNIVYLPRQGRVLFRTSARPAIRWADLARFEPGCETPARMLDIQAELEGDVAGRFQDWTQAANRDLLRVTFRDLPLPPGLGEVVSAFPAALPCLPAGTH